MIEDGNKTEECNGNETDFICLPAMRQEKWHCLMV